MSRRRIRPWPLVRLALTVGIVAFLFVRADGVAAFERAASAPWWVYVVPSALLFANSCLHAVRLRLLLSPAPPWSGVLRAVLLGNFFGLLLPTGGGEAVKGLALGRLTGHMEPAFGALAASRLLEFGPWGGLLVWAGLVVLPGRLDAYVPPTLLAAAAMLTLFAVTWAILLAPARVLGWVPVWAGRERWIRVASVQVGRGRLLWCAALAVPFALVNCFVVYAILRGYGVQIAYPEVLGLIPSLDVIISLPITIAGVGVREGMFVVGLGPWGAAPPVAMAAATTRWSGELFRAGLGGLWWALSGAPAADSPPSRHDTVTGIPPAAGLPSGADDG